MSTIQTLTYAKPGKYETTRFEKIHNVIFKTAADASIIVAQEIADLIRSKQEKNKKCVLVSYWL